jgi:hypothetical protein
MIGENVGGVRTITSVFCEPAENVLVGVVTANNLGTEGSFFVEDAELEEIMDLRIPSRGFHNAFGFAVNPATIPVGVGAAAEGYVNNDGTNKLYHFLVEADGGDLLNDVPQTSILRARCDPGGRLEVQGASYLPAIANIQIQNAKTGFIFGIQQTTLAADIRFGEYRFRFEVSTGEVDTDGACPSEVRAVNLANSTFAEAPVDGVTAPPTPRRRMLLRRPSTIQLAPLSGWRPKSSFWPTTPIPTATRPSTRLQ